MGEAKRPSGHFECRYMRSRTKREFEELPCNPPEYPKLTWTMAYHGIWGVEWEATVVGPTLPSTTNASQLIITLRIRFSIRGYEKASRPRCFAFTMSQWPSCASSTKWSRTAAGTRTRSPRKMQPSSTALSARQRIHEVWGLWCVPWPTIDA